jgi:serine/threonine-protein kinase
LTSSLLIDHVRPLVSEAFLLDEEWPSGGSARLFAAREVGTGRLVVLKVFVADPALPRVARRFDDEVRLARTLDHPRIVPVLAAGERGPFRWYAMPRLPGGSLRDRLVRERQLALADAVAIATDVAAALDAAAAHGVIHRDVKPSNVLFDAEGRALVSDFGIAREAERPAGHDLTSADVALGTPAYMSPEQATGRAQVDARTDQYALACLVFEMLTGMPPFTGATAQAVLSRHAVEPPPSLVVVRPDVPRTVEAVIERALAKVPAARFPSAGAFAAALAAATNATSAPRRPWARRVAWAGAAAIALAMGWGAWRVARARGDTPVASAPAPVERLAILPVADAVPGATASVLAVELTARLARELAGTTQLSLVSVPEREPPPAAGGASPRVPGVDHVLAARLERDGARVRLALDLRDARTDAPVARATFAHEGGARFEVEDALAGDATRWLRPRLGQLIRVRRALAGTRSAEARAAYEEAARLIEGIAFGDDGPATAGGDLARLARAEEQLAVAMRADPAWSDAPLLRTRATSWSARLAPVAPVATAWRDIEADLARAQRAGAAPAELHEARALAALRLARRSPGTEELAPGRSPLDVALAEFDSTLAADSTRTDARAARALALALAGRLGEATAAGISALRLDEFRAEAPQVATALFAAALLAGRLDDAREWCDMAARAFPAAHGLDDCALAVLAEGPPQPGWRARADSLLARSMRDQPTARLRATGRGEVVEHRRLLHASVLARAGAPDQARAALREAEREARRDTTLVDVVAYDGAWVRLSLGDTAGAAALLEAYAARRPYFAASAWSHARWAGLADWRRRHPR